LGLRVCVDDQAGDLEIGKEEVEEEVEETPHVSSPRMPLA
jgi:hypothetical protein